MALQKPVFLIGMMGAGKTHWGLRLAAHFGVPFLDTDQMIEASTGTSIPAMFAEPGGEKQFRAYEHQLLLSYPWPDACIVSCGGGLPCFHENMDILLQLGKVIWLNPAVEEMVQRIWEKRHNRPLVAESQSREDLMNHISRLLTARTKIYNQAHAVITDPSPEIQDFLDVLDINGNG